MTRMRPSQFLKSGCAVLLLTSVSFAEQPPAPVRTLKDAYERALQISERIAISEQSIREAESLYRQALGGAFPEASVEHQTLWQDRRGVGATRPESPVSNGMLRLTKTGLTGYREIYAIKSGRAFIRQREFERLRVNQLLLSDVAGAFFGLLQAGENVLSTKKLQDLAGKRLGELRDRVRVGRTRDADAIEQQFQITTLDSQLEESARTIGARTDLLSYLTGSPVKLDDLHPEDSSAAPSPLETYLSRIENRPDVQAARSALRVAETSLGIARSGHFPRLDLVGNYYLYRPHSKEGIDWDAALNLGVPLFSWGATQGAVDAARAVLRQNEEALRAIQRQADLDIRNAYRDWLSALRQLELNGKAIDLARRDYELQMRDDRRSLVTSLEVLESLNRLNAAELTLTTARLNARLAALNLELAAGTRPEEILK